MPLNGVGRDVPDRIPGYGDVRPFVAGDAPTRRSEAPETDRSAETRGRSGASSASISAQAQPIAEWLDGKESALCFSSGVQLVSPCAR